MNYETLIGDNIILRKAKYDDYKNMLKSIWSDEEIYKWMLFKPTFSEEDAIARINRTIEYQKNNYAYIIALKDNDLAIGFCGIKENDKGHFEESGIAIAKEYQGKGYGKELLKLLLDLVFNKLDGIDFLYGYYNDNIKSKGLANSFNFKYQYTKEMVRPWDNTKKIIDYCLLKKSDYIKIKSGLIMEGGAMRGVFTLGVIDVLMENGIKFDGCAGISAGAIFGSNYKSGQIGRGIRYNKRFCKDKRYCSIRSLIKTGDLYNVEFCYHELPNKLDIFDKEAFKNNKIDFYVGATDINTGDVIFHNCLNGDELDILWMRASGSMPIVSKVVEIDNYKLLDGGISCPVPYEYMESIGYNKNLIILTQPKNYRKKKSSKLLINFFLRKLPKIKEAMLNRYNIYNKQMDEIDEREKNGEAIVIRPNQKLDLSKTEKNKDKLEKAYQMGRLEALKRLEEIKKFLGDKNATN